MERLHSQREPYADALRVIAILGVFLVNGMGYLSAPGVSMPMGTPSPQADVLSLLVYGFAFFFFQGKAWPLLCLLFGYSLQSIALQLHYRGLSVRAGLRSRYWKLLLIGIAHGLLIYFGDVLTIYAIAGLIATRWAASHGANRIKASRLLRVWKWFLAASILVILFIVLVSIGIAQEAALKPVLFSQTTGWYEFFKLNATYYGYVAMSSASVYLPFYAWLTLSGMLCWRFRLLGTRHFSQRFWRGHLGMVQLAASSLINALLMAYALHSFYGGSSEGELVFLASLAIAPNVWWVACCLAWFMRRTNSLRAPVLLWLVSAGRYSLLMYIGLSMSLMLGVSPVLGGPLTSLFEHTALAFAVLVGAWFVAVCLARAAALLGLRDPISGWLGSSHRRIQQKAG